MGLDLPVRWKLYRISMEITIMHTPDCPNVARAQERTEQALRELRLEPVQIRLEVVVGPEEAQRLGFRGSPTILVDGDDPFVAAGTPFAFACRLYMTPDGPDAAPSVEQLRHALERSRP
jgi:hypothetical protein